MQNQDFDLRIFGDLLNTGETSIEKCMAFCTRLERSRDTNQVNIQFYEGKNVRQDLDEVVRNLC